MWNVKTKALPVITGTILKSFRQDLSNIPWKHEIKELQKTSPLDIAHTAGSTDVKYKTFNKRINITCSTKCKYTAAATVYTQEKCFVWGV
jgi:hypothetical protein